MKRLNHWKGFSKEPPSLKIVELPIKNEYHEKYSKPGVYEIEAIIEKIKQKFSGSNVIADTTPKPFKTLSSIFFNFELMNILGIINTDY